MMSENNDVVVFAVALLSALALFSMGSTITIVSAANNTTTHLACISNTCMLVNGTGTNECFTVGAFCNFTNQTHLACVNNACVSVAGSGQNQCTSSSQCSGGNQTNQTHLECRNNTCTLVQGVGTNQCSTPNSFCNGTSNQTHLACVGMACQVVSGAGNNTCSVNNDCRHLACAGPVSNRSCQYVAGSGDNECDLGEYCGSVGGVVNKTKIRLSPAAVAALPGCNSWFKRIFSRTCKNEIAAAQEAVA